MMVPLLVMFPVKMAGLVFDVHGLVDAVGDVAVDGGGAAGEGEDAVIGEAGPPVEQEAVAGDLAGVGEGARPYVESAAGEGDDSGVGGKSLDEQNLLLGVGLDLATAGIGDAARRQDQFCRSRDAADGIGN